MVFLLLLVKAADIVAVAAIASLTSHGGSWFGSGVSLVDFLLKVAEEVRKKKESGSKDGNGQVQIVEQAVVFFCLGIETLQV